MAAVALGVLVSFSSALPASAVESGASRVADEKRKDAVARANAPTKEQRMAKQNELMKKISSKAKIAP